MLANGLRCMYLKKMERSYKHERIYEPPLTEHGLKVCVRMGELIPDLKPAGNKDKHPESASVHDLIVLASCPDQLLDIVHVQIPTSSQDTRTRACRAANKSRYRMTTRH